MYNFEPYNVLLSIATNIAVLLLCSRDIHIHIYTHTYIHTYIIMQVFPFCQTESDRQIKQSLWSKARLLINVRLRGITFTYRGWWGVPSSRDSRQTWSLIFVSLLPSMRAEGGPGAITFSTGGAATHKKNITQHYQGINSAWSERALASLSQWNGPAVNENELLKQKYSMQLNYREVIEWWQQNQKTKLSLMSWITGTVGQNIKYYYNINLMFSMWIWVKL